MADVTDAAEEGAGAIDLEVTGELAVRVRVDQHRSFASGERTSAVPAPFAYSVTVTDANGCEAEGGLTRWTTCMGWMNLARSNSWPFPTHPARVDRGVEPACGQASMTVHDNAGRVVWRGAFAGQRQHSTCQDGHLGPIRCTLPTVGRLPALRCLCSTKPGESGPTTLRKRSGAVISL